MNHGVNAPNGSVKSFVLLPSAFLTGNLDPLRETDRQLRQDLTPMRNPNRPAARHVTDHQVQHFQERLIGGNKPLPLVNFRSCRLKLSITLVVYIRRRSSGGKPKNVTNSDQFVFHDATTRGYL